MIAAASPRLSERLTPERIASGPRGVAYCLVIFAASSMDARVEDTGVNMERTGRHPRHAVVLAHAFGAAPAQFLEPRAILPERQDSFGERRCAAGVDQEAAARPSHNF